MELSQNPQPSSTRPPGITAWHAPAVASKSAASGVPNSRGMAVSASTPAERRLTCRKMTMVTESSNVEAIGWRLAMHAVQECTSNMACYQCDAEVATHCKTMQSAEDLDEQPRPSTT